MPFVNVSSNFENKFKHMVIWNLCMYTLFVVVKINSYICMNVHMYNNYSSNPSNIVVLSMSI